MAKVDIDVSVIRGLKAGDMLVVRVPEEQTRDRGMMRQIVEYIQRELGSVGLTNRVGVALSSKQWDLERVEGSKAKKLFEDILRKEGTVDPAYEAGWRDGALATAINAEVQVKTWNHDGVGGLKWDDILTEIAERIEPAKVQKR